MSLVAQHSEEILPDGRQRVVRHGYGPERSIQTGIGALEVQRPKVRDRAANMADEKKIRFSSAILPKWARRSRSLEALFPVLYLRGLSMEDVQEALAAILGTCLSTDREALLAFYDCPAEHWDHLRTGNPIESVFANVPHRSVQTKGALSQKTAKLMVFKLVQAAGKTWRRLKGANQLPLVIEGVTFPHGVAATDPENSAA